MSEQVKFDNAKLLAWLRLQPKRKTYDYWCTNCLMGQFFSAQGFSVDMVGRGEIKINGVWYKLPLSWVLIARGGEYVPPVRTPYGRALKVAEQLLAEPAEPGS